MTAETVIAATRQAGFSDEVKRRIILGTHVLSAGYYDAYYGNAQKVRTLVQEDFAKAFAKADVLVSPTAPTTAFKFGEKTDNPMEMYLNDVATIPANLAGFRALPRLCRPKTACLLDSRYWRRRAGRGHVSKWLVRSKRGSWRVNRSSAPATLPGRPRTATDWKEERCDG